MAAGAALAMNSMIPRFQEVKWNVIVSDLCHLARRQVERCKLTALVGQPSRRACHVSKGSVPDELRSEAGWLRPSAGEQPVSAEQGHNRLAGRLVSCVHARGHAWPCRSERRQLVLNYCRKFTQKSQRTLERTLAYT